MKDLDKDTGTDSLTSLEETLQAREILIRDYMEKEKSMLDQSSQERAEKAAFWENLITETKVSAQRAQVSSYQSTAKTIARFLGIGIKEQAMLMIPFEVAEATKEMALFLATKDPSHLAASLKHTLAVSQYAAAAKTSAGAGASSAGSGSSAARAGAGGSPENKGASERDRRHATVVVNVGDGVVTHPKEFARQMIDGLNEAYQDDVHIEFAS